MNMKKLMLIVGVLFAAMGVQTQQLSAQPPQTPHQTQRQYLSGTGYDDAVEWEFMVTGGRRAGEWTTIPVPSCWELQGFGTYQYGMQFYGQATPPGIANEQGVYRYRFHLPAEWENKMVRLVFEGVMTDATVRINNQRAIRLHQGAFYRFKTLDDITERFNFGDKENLLEVTVNKESANR